MAYVMPEDYQDYDQLCIGQTLVVRSRDGWLRGTRVKIINFLSDGRLIVETEYPVSTKETDEYRTTGAKLADGHIVMSRFDLRRVFEQ